MNQKGNMDNYINERMTVNYGQTIEKDEYIITEHMNNHDQAIDHSNYKAKQSPGEKITEEKHSPRTNDKKARKGSNNHGSNTPSNI